MAAFWEGQATLGRTGLVSETDSPSHLRFTPCHFGFKTSLHLHEESLLVARPYTHVDICHVYTYSSIRYIGIVLLYNNFIMYKALAMDVILVKTYRHCGSMTYKIHSPSGLGILYIILPSCPCLNLNHYIFIHVNIHTCMHAYIVPYIHQNRPTYLINTLNVFYKSALLSKVRTCYISTG